MLAVTFALMDLLAIVTPATYVKEGNVLTLDITNQTQKYQFADGFYQVLKVIPATWEGWHPYDPLPDMVAEACGSIENMCEGRIVGENHELPLDVMVAMCKPVAGTCPREVRPLKPKPIHDRSTLCIPNVFGLYLDRSFLPFVDNFIRYYWSQQFTHIYMYSHESPPRWLRGMSWESRITWIQLSFPTDDLWYSGQNWAIQDCIHRATAEGFQNVLSIDLDEFLTVTDRNRTIVGYMEHLRGMGFDVAEFGSSLDERLQDCRKAAEPSCDLSPPTNEEISCGLGIPECAKYEAGDRRFCASFCGHRKHIVYGPRALTANIHFVDSCLLGSCAIKTESTDIAWIRHYQGSGAGSALCPSCLRS